jgi:chloramphenicol O-acetyltransferase type A
MRVIEMDSWPRRQHFNLYNAMDFPHINLCMQVDITGLWAVRSRLDVSPTIILTYVITRAANNVPEFRQRIQGDVVVEYEVVHPLITVLGENDLFGVTTLEYDPDFNAFAASAGERILKARDEPSLTEFLHDPGAEPARDDMLSMTILPWLVFTGFAITRRPQNDTIPLIAWGKVRQDGEGSMLPLFVNSHHALVDGVHIARFAAQIEQESQHLVESFR